MQRIEQLTALIHKEILQVIRDPSCILIAFVLPLILLFIFGYGLSLDAKHLKTAIVLEDKGPYAQSFYQTLKATKYIDAYLYETRESAQNAIANSQVRSVVVVPNDFTRNIRISNSARIQLIADGAETNTAIIMENYILGIVGKWSYHQSQDLEIAIRPMVDVKTRVFFNPELNTRNALIPGSIVLIMAIIGVLLTALVVAREWERGTMEAMLATPIRKSDLMFGKLFPYYLLGMGSTAACTFISYFLFGVPFRGSAGAMFLVSSVFLIASLAQGFLISTITRNQFLASQLAMMVAFIPNLMFSGTLFEISSMPLPIQWITYIFPARYYVTSLQTIFMAGDIWPLLFWCMKCMSAIAAVFLVIAFAITPKRL